MNFPVDSTANVSLPQYEKAAELFTYTVSLSKTQLTLCGKICVCEHIVEKKKHIILHHLNNLIKQFDTTIINIFKHCLQIQERSRNLTRGMSNMLQMSFTR